MNVNAGPHYATEDVECSQPLSPHHFSEIGRENVRCGSDLLEEFSAEFQIYRTRMHKEIGDVLLARARALSLNLYVGRRGDSSAAIVGALGIGKSHMLRAFLNICPRVVPNVYCIYISFKRILLPDVRFEASIITILIVKLREMGVEVPVSDSNRAPKDHLLHHLCEHCLRVLVLVDDLDQLYRTKDAAYVRVVHDLAALGDQGTGAISVLVCGSTVNMGVLLTSTSDDRIRREYPLKTMGTVSLRDKCPIQRVESALPTDLEVVAGITSVVNNDINKPWLRLLAFASGCSPRTTSLILDDYFEAGITLPRLSADCRRADCNAPEAAQLHALILRQIYQKNKRALHHLLDTDTGSLVVEKVATVAWEEHALFLTFDEVEKIWENMHKGKAFTSRSESTYDLLYNMFHLFDRGWLTMSGVVDQLPRRIYPCSMLHLMRQFIPDHVLPSALDALMGAVKGGVAGAGQYVVDSPATRLSANCCVVM